MAFSKQSDFDSFTQDSDEVHEMYCEECERLEKKYVCAEGFCVDCKDYMCAVCLKYHKRYMSAHTLRNKDSMPQDFCFQKCSVHINELVKYYCEKCQTFACSQCKTNYHSCCSRISHLPALVKGIEKSKELKFLTESMNELSNELERVEKHVNLQPRRAELEETRVILEMKREKEEILATSIKHQQAVIDGFEKKMKETIARLKKERQELIEQSNKKKKNLEMKLDVEEKIMMKKIENAKEADQKEMKKIKDKNLIMKQVLKTLSSELTQHQNTGQRCKLFIAMKKTETNIGKLKQDMSMIKENCNIHYAAEECEEHVEENAEGMDIKDSSKIDRTAQYNSYIQTSQMEFSSLCFLSEDMLLVTDFNGRSLIIFRDIKESTTTFDKVQVDGQPWAVAKVSNNTVAVTFPYTGFVRLIKFSESVTVNDPKDIEVGTQCRGIASNNNTLIVSYWTAPAKVQILDMSGKVLKTITKNDKGQHLFVTPHHLALGLDNTAIYVSDSGSDSVLSLTFDGKVKAIYKNDKLKEPYQLTVDRLGAVYVCGASSQNVHQLSADLKKVKILLNGGHEIHKPVSVSYCQQSRKLYVGMQNSNIIKVFNLTLFFLQHQENVAY